MKRISLMMVCLLVALAAMAQQPKIGKGPKNGKFTFMQIADPQLGYCGKDKDLQWTIDNLKDAVKKVNELKPAFVIVSGDMVHRHFKSEQVAAYREEIAKIDPSIPVFHIPGNHDMPKYSDSSIKQYMDNFGYDRFAFKYGKAAFIGINSNAMMCDTVTAHKDAKEQLVWLEKQLKKYQKCKQIFVFTHHPINLAEGSPIKHKSAYDEPYRTQYAELMAKYHVTAIFAGHTHYTELTTTKGMPMIIVGASSYPLYGSYTGLNIVNVTPTNFDANFVANDPKNQNIKLH